MPFLTPNELIPLVAIELSLPEEFVSTFMGSVFELSLESNWEEYGLLTTAAAAAAMRDAYNTIQVSEPFPPKLQNSLAAYWTMNETSGNRLDSQPRHYDLVDNGGIGFEAGKMGNAATLTQSPQKYFSLADDELTSIGNRSFTLAGWIKFSSNNFVATQPLWGKYKITNDGNRDWFFRKLANGQLEWNVSSDGTNFSAVTSTLFGSIAHSVWYFAVCRYDHANGLSSVSVNEKLNAVGHSGGVHDGNSPFYIGRQAASYANAAVDALAFFNHAITQSQENWLYNSGNGRLYAEIMAYEG
jgi:hypothetical protein